MGIRHLPIATNRTAIRALDAALVLSQLDGHEPSSMAKRECLLSQLEPPL